jgi:hypothetical protein
MIQSNFPRRSERLSESPFLRKVINRVRVEDKRADILKIPDIDPLSISADNEQEC